MRVEEYRSCSSTANRVKNTAVVRRYLALKDQKKDSIVSSLVAIVHNSSY